MRMAEPLNRRQLLTDALPRGLADLAAGFLRARADIAGLRALAESDHSPANDLAREVDEILARSRQDHPDWYSDGPEAAVQPDEPVDSEHMGSGFPNWFADDPAAGGSAEPERTEPAES
jgi:hypothetical protein